MGLPLPSGVGASGIAPAGDQANAVVSGQITAAGQVSAPFCFYGAFNVTLYLSAVASLTTTAASTAAVGGVSTPASALLTGQNVFSTIVPRGANLAAVGNSLTTLTLGGLTATQIAALTAQTDAAAVFVGPGITGDLTVALERSFDGGNTWLTCNLPNTAGTPISVQLNTAHVNNPVTFTVGEPEQGVAYRLHCTAYASGTGNYRISATGAGAKTWAPK